jgi:hypothetical protein
MPSKKKRSPEDAFGQAVAQPAAPLGIQPIAPVVAPPPVNAKQQKTRLSKTAKATLTLRAQLWPAMDESKLWLRTDHTRKGFTTIPRGMPLIMDMIADASKQVTRGKSVPAGKSYLVLWCRVFDEGMVRIDNEPTAAFEAGYTGERNISTWREHLRVLKELGFIDYKQGPAGPAQYVLLINPYHAVKTLRSKDWVQELKYIALLQRMSEVGATDLEEAP